jgi:ribonuclease HI
MNKIEKVQIFTDGACKGNPGPGGWGAILRFQDNEKELNGYNILTTNNIMELTAVIESLKAISKPFEIEITTDSKYVKNGITAWIHNWKRNGWKTASKKPVKNKELWIRLDKLIQKHNISWKWVKGHSGHLENERADELANEAITNNI